MCGIAFLAAVPTAAGAVDDPTDSGLWYFTKSGMTEVHQRTQGEGITIAVLDGPVNLAAPDLVGTDLTVHEPGYCAAETDGPPVDAVKHRV